MPDAPDTATLLVLLPGAYMKPDDYMGIIAGLRVSLPLQSHSMQDVPHTVDLIQPFLI